MNATFVTVACLVVIGLGLYSAMRPGVGDSGVFGALLIVAGLLFWVFAVGLGLLAPAITTAISAG